MYADMHIQDEEIEEHRPDQFVQRGLEDLLYHAHHEGEGLFEKNEDGNMTPRAVRQAKLAALEAAFSGCAGRPTALEKNRRKGHPDLEKEAQGAAGRREHEPKQRQANPTKSMSNIHNLPVEFEAWSNIQDSARGDGSFKGMAGKSTTGAPKTRSKGKCDGNINRLRRERRSLLHHHTDPEAAPEPEEKPKFDGSAGSPTSCLAKFELDNYLHGQRGIHEKHMPGSEFYADRQAVFKTLDAAPWRQDEDREDDFGDDGHHKKHYRTQPQSMFSKVVYGRASPHAAKTMSLHAFNHFYGGAAGMTSHKLAKKATVAGGQFVFAADHIHTHDAHSHNPNHGLAHGSLHGSSVGDDLSSTISDIASGAGMGFGDVYGASEASRRSGTPRSSRASVAEDGRRVQTPRSNQGSGYVASIAELGNENDGYFKGQTTPREERTPRGSRRGSEAQ
jgi:hypothetical protein